ncbi:MAG: carboxypeptidase-like regulatory domain-containing protein, partial [Planctomycetota bacterium]
MSIPHRHLSALVYGCLLAVAWIGAWAPALYGQQGERLGKPVGQPSSGGDAELILWLKFPKDASDAEKQAVVGGRLTLVGRPGLAHGPAGEILQIVVPESRRLRVRGLHGWIYELQAGGPHAPQAIGGTLGPFCLRLDQFFYPRPGGVRVKDVELQRTTSIRGRVVDATGRGLGAARITARWGRRSIHGDGAKTTTLSAGDGSFELRDVPPGVGSIESVLAPWKRASKSGDALEELLGSGAPLELVHQEADAPGAKEPERSVQLSGESEAWGVQTGAIHGQLVDREGKRLAHATLRARVSAGQSLGQAEWFHISGRDVVKTDRT